MEAEKVDIIRTTPSIILTCRPCHTGFVKRINEVRHERSWLFYIGLEKNLETDLSDTPYFIDDVGVVGEEGEKIWIVFR